MQALIITCLLCLQTSNPCDSNPVQPFNEGVDCSKCLADLKGYLNLSANNISSSNSTETVQMVTKTVQDEISPKLKENLDTLLSDLESTVEDMSQNPDQFKDLMNKVKIEINQDLQSGTQSHGGQSGKPMDAEALKKVQKQEYVLRKINEKFGELFHQSDALKEKFKIMRGILSLDSPAEGMKRRRDTVGYGERLMLGEELVSRNGKWRYIMDPKTGEHVLSDSNGKEIKRSIYCTFPKPLSPNLHLVMNNYAEYYWDIVNGKSENLVCSSVSSMACGAVENARCYLRLDNDGHLKFFTASGEPTYTFY